MATFNIPEELEHRLAAIARSRQVSVESLTMETLNDYVKEQERYEQEKDEDEARWQRYLRTGEAITREDMNRKLQNLAKQATIKTG
jgi:predicted transcriptional regulator